MRKRGIGSGGAPAVMRILFALLPPAIIGLQWATDTVRPGNLLMTVPRVTELPWLESRFTYLYLHLFTLIPVLALSFDRNVHYYRKWKHLAPAIAIVGTGFILWDVFFTARGVWGFNHEYLLGVFWLGLPLEEWLFFVTVPFACVFIYECLNFYVKRDWLAPIERPITLGLTGLFLVVGGAHWSHMYTATTFLLAGFLLLFHLLFADGSYRGRFYLAYLISWAPFLLVNGVLTGGYTRQPIVIYNPEEYLGLRITSVPVDDSVYSFVLLLGAISLFEHFRKK